MRVDTKAFIIIPPLCPTYKRHIAVFLDKAYESRTTQKIFNRVPLSKN